MPTSPSSQDPPGERELPEDRAISEVKAPSSRINIAFPFSQIKLQEAGRELAELTALVLDLIVALEATTDGQLVGLRERATALVARLSS
jgi:hypothetical protein